MDRCQAIRVDGSRCTNKTTNGTNTCAIASHVAQIADKVDQTVLKRRKAGRRYD